LTKSFARAESPSLRNETSIRASELHSMPTCHRSALERHISEQYIANSHSPQHIGGEGSRLKH
jgi:hypothetical protein